MSISGGLGFGGLVLELGDTLFRQFHVRERPMARDGLLDLGVHRLLRLLEGPLASVAKRAEAIVMGLPNEPGGVSLATVIGVTPGARG